MMFSEVMEAIKTAPLSRKVIAALLSLECARLVIEWFELKMTLGDAVPTWWVVAFAFSCVSGMIALLDWDSSRRARWVAAGRSVAKAKGWITFALVGFVGVKAAWLIPIGISWLFSKVS